MKSEVVMSTRQFYWKTPGYDKPIGKLTYDADTNSYVIEGFESEFDHLPLSLRAIVEFHRNP